MHLKATTGDVQSGSMRQHCEVTMCFLFCILRLYTYFNTQFQTCCTLAYYSILYDDPRYSHILTTFRVVVATQL